MKTATCHVDELDAEQRSAVERLIGQRLGRHQQVVIQVLDESEPSTSNLSTAASKPAWEGIYDGLTDEQIDRLDAAIRRRADLTRVSE